MGSVSCPYGGMEERLVWVGLEIVEDTIFTGRIMVLHGFPPRLNDGVSGCIDKFRFTGLELTSYFTRSMKQTFPYPHVYGTATSSPLLRRIPLITASAGESRASRAITELSSSR